MNVVKPLYLTCTASQAEEFNANHGHGFQSLNELLEARAESHGDVYVAGFPEQSSDAQEWTVLKFTYSSLLEASNSVAMYYEEATTLRRRTTEEKDRRDRIIALLCPSCADFLVTLFAAIRLGYGVLLLAPQNTDEAIAHLCKATSATHLICHRSLLERGHNAQRADPEMSIIPMASRAVWHGVQLSKPIIKPILSPSEEADRVALVMHTSGSTGMPKPIYQSHRIWTQAMPCMPWNPAFTTTPLFHGGSCDILRSLNALSMLYMFPSTTSVTSANVVGAVAACSDAAAFLSVPYILKMLAEDDEGMEMLKRMDLVSVGGAPLPESLGNEMVRQGVKLVSRLGSSECGFLMSSHRDYDTDTEWSWLRNDALGIKMLRFEPVDDSESMFELVVDKQWSTRVVSNRDDGSFATGDLYAKHPSLPHAWRYSGRADDIIVMMNGKKASANAIETQLRASPEISEAIVFGASKPMLGVLIVPAYGVQTRDELLQYVHKVNASGASYAAIIDDMIVCLPHDAKLPKTSKGSIIRPQALKLYADVIEDAYRRFERGPSEADCHNVVSDDDVIDHVRQLVFTAVKTLANQNRPLEFSDDDDLFSLGLTSLHAVQIRGSLQKVIVSSGQVLGNNVVFEYPSVRKLAQHIVDIRAGRNREIDHTEPYDLMKRLLNQYGHFDNVTTASARGENSDAKGIVVVTGATGALGAHILTDLIARTDVYVVALVRAADDEDAAKRLADNLEERKLNTIDGARYCAVSATLSEERLGLSEALYEKLIAECILIIHAAWPVNFAYSLGSFSPVLRGTQSLLRLSASTVRRANFVFCSTIAAVSNKLEPLTQAIPERMFYSEKGASPMGYAQAKWVAEHMCDLANRTTALSGRVAIARIGQLCGDTVNGIWNEKEGWPLMISTAQYTGCLPALEESVSWLPLDVAAKVIVELSSIGIQWPKRTQECPVYHVLHPNKVAWATVLGYLEQSGLVFDRVPPHIWLRKLRDSSTSRESSYRNLLDLWERNYGDIGTAELAHEPEFETNYTRAFSPALGNAPKVSLELVRKMLQRWQETGFIP